MRTPKRDVFPLCPSEDSSAPRRESDADAATLSQRRSSSHGKRYLREPIALSPRLPNTGEILSPVPCRCCALPLHSLKRQQTPIGFAGHAIWRCEPTSPSPCRHRSEPAMASPRHITAQRDSKILLWERRDDRAGLKGNGATARPIENRANQ